MICYTSLDEMNVSYWELIESYCINKLRIENVTTNGHIKFLRSWIKTFNTINNTDYNFHKKINKLSTPKKHYAVLSEDEIFRIKQMNFSEIKLIKYKFYMIFQATTGIRVSDLGKLNREQINIASKELNIYLTKNKVHVRIPLPDWLMKQIETMNYVFPKFNEPEYNLCLKDMCKQAGIDSPFEHKKYIGSEVITSMINKYEAVSSHSMRRSFITNQIRNSMPVELLMKITGHTDRESLDKYIHLSQDEAVSRLRSLQQ